MKVINGKVDGFIGIDKIYIGRYNKYYNLKESPLHNPYKVSIGRDDAIALYKKHLWQSIKAMRDGKPVDRVMGELINIARVEYVDKIEISLVCWCKPLPCHGDIIVNAIEWLKDQEWFLEYLF